MSSETSNATGEEQQSQGEDLSSALSTGGDTEFVATEEKKPVDSQPDAERAAKMIPTKVEGTYRGGELKVVTTGARPGYLQKNGVPYSANAVFTEFFNRYEEPEGWSMLVVSTLTEDPSYLQQPHIRSSHYKKLPDATGWNPMPCSAR